MGYAMETMESTAFEQTILKLGLVTPNQLAEVHEEIGEAPDLWQLIATLERKSFLTPWQRGKVLKGDTDGFILGGYKLLYKIQSGSFGRVYRAVDPRDGRVVAVKVLRRRWSENEQRIEMFIREGKVGLMLKHPNIVEVLAISRDPLSAQYYIVMEFVEGGNLREILQIRKKLSAAESLRIIEDCANGLAYAYSRGMTHRDIKLTNILISDTGEAKLVDFGLAQFFASAARTEEEKVDRTVDYAGLERATEVKQGDIRSDIYFLGCVLYECLTGRPPLEMTKDKHARMRRARFEQVKPIHPNEIDAPPSVLMLVETMMAFDPKERYQTPSQMLDAIRRVRRDVEGNSGNGDDRPPTRSVFLAEPDERLQDVLRDGLKDQGYRVFLAGDPMRALDRFHKQPFDGLIVDARTTGEEGLRVFEHIIDEADRRRLRCAALLLLDEEQAEWAERLPKGPHIGIMTRDIKFNKMSRKLKELMKAAHDSTEFPVLAHPAPVPPAPLLPPPPPPVIEAPPVPVSRVVEMPSAREEVAPPMPRREPKPAAFSPPPPPRRKETGSQPFVAFSFLTDDSLDDPLPFDLGEEEVTPPPRREPKREEDEVPASLSPLPSRPAPAPPPQPEPMAPAAFSPSLPREEATPPPPRREPMPAPFSSPPREEAVPPPRHEPMTASPPPAHSQPAEDDLPMLALEGGIVLPPPEESPPLPRRLETAPPPPRRLEAVVPPPRQEAAPPPRQEAAPPPRQEAAPPPRRPENVVPPLRRAEPRRKRELQPVTQHLTHEDPLTPPDVHHWRDELGVPEEKKEKENVGTRLQNIWKALSPTQKSIAGLVLLALVVGLFFVYMISDMVIQNKFDKIQEGMSVEEVEAILGAPGEKVDLNPKHKGRGPVGPIKPETRKWEMGSKIITVLFSNGKVVEGGKQIQEK